MNGQSGCASMARLVWACVFDDQLEFILEVPIFRKSIRSGWQGLNR